MATSMVSAAATVSRSAPVQVSMVAPITGLKSSAAFPRKNGDITRFASNCGRVSCMNVWSTEGKRKFEMPSYLQPLTREELGKQIKYLFEQNHTPSLEFALEEAFPHRENERSPGHYGRRHGKMWKLPMSECTDPLQVLTELEEAIDDYPHDFVRILGFDHERQVQAINFVAYKRPGHEDEF